MAAAADMAARLKGHMTQHLAIEKIRALKDLHAILVDAATAHAADPLDQADCRIVALLAVNAAGPKEADCLPPVQRPPLSPAPPPRVAHPDETAPAPQQVPPRPAAEWSHFLSQAPETTPRHNFPTTPAALRRESPRRSQGPLNAATRPTRLAALKARLVDKDERDAARQARRLEKLQPPQLEGPAMHTHRKMAHPVHNKGPATCTQSRTTSGAQHSMFSCCEIRQQPLSARAFTTQRYPK